MFKHSDLIQLIKSWLQVAPVNEFFIEKTAKNKADEIILKFKPKKEDNKLVK